MFVILNFLPLQQTDLESETATSQSSTQASAPGPKRLHVSNIPFRFREADLRNLLGVRIINLRMRSASAVMYPPYTRISIFVWLRSHHINTAFCFHNFMSQILTDLFIFGTTVGTEGRKLGRNLSKIQNSGFQDFSC
jgi:hypothetical protein